MIRQYLAGAMFFGIAACTAPGPEMPESNAVAASGVVDETGLICKTETASGSLMRKKTCLSAAEWKRMEAGAQEYMEKRRSDDNRGIR
jgi:hypothetical protein